MNCHKSISFIWIVWSTLCIYLWLWHQTLCYKWYRKEEKEERTTYFSTKSNKVSGLEFHYDPCVGSVKYLFWYLSCELTWHIGDFCIYFSWIFLKKDILWRNIRLCTLKHQNHDFVTNSLYDLDRSKSHILQFCTTTTHWTILIVNFYNR